MPLTLLIALFATLVSIAACAGDPDHLSGGDVSEFRKPAELEDVRGAPIASLRAELLRLLATRPVHATEELWERTKTLYRSYLTSPLWFDDDGLIEDRANALVDALVNATTDAIRIDERLLLEISNAVAGFRGAEQPTARQIARADLLLTTAYVGLASDYLDGQVDPKSVGQSWHIGPEAGALDSALTRALREADLAAAFERMRPRGQDYEMLRRELAKYRKIVAAGGWPAIPSGKSLGRGDAGSPERLHALRARLRMEGIQSDSAAGALFDQSLAAAVAEFQKRHGIVVDSQLGKETLDALNVPATFRLTQIAANLERYRWLPRALGSRYIIVNVPAFRLEGFDNGRKAIEMKVIVGAEYEGRATPVFSDSMEFVVFRPYWIVTPKIAENELFPKFGGGMPPDYETYNEKGRLRLRQRPGPRNALGLVKFMFPNDFSIYLHDTPQDNLFKENVRAFSHGCIRVEKPNELAQWVLGWDAERVRKAMEVGPNSRHVPLPGKIPVYIAYMTTYARDGQLWFGNDLYGRDQELLEAVAAGAMPTVEAGRAVARLRQLTD